VDLWFHSGEGHGTYCFGSIGLAYKCISLLKEFFPTSVIMKRFLKGLSGALIVLVAVAALIFLAALFIKGGAWVSAVVLPFINLLSRIALFFTIVVFLPLSFLKKTRPFTGFMLLITSYVFGLAAWLKGFFWAYNIWGVVGVLIGVFLFGVGVVPVGALALLLNGIWEPMFALLLTVGAMYACRTYSVYVLTKAENETSFGKVIDI